ncbi:MAG TPA: MBL fold metallo-hydrolase [Clostridium sp.]|nr:MBL fold metallo-hydrolase [Clostridium sp.]
MKRLLSFFISFALTLLLISCGNATNSKAETRSSLNAENTSVETSISSGTQSATVNGQLKVHFIDVGQADCILLQQGNENMLIDAGNNDDEQTIKNYLQSLGVNEFKYVIGTHPHEDHIGSMDYIMNSFKVGKIYFPKATATTKTFENLVNAVKNKGMQFAEPTPGETFKLGQAKCTILAPNNSGYEDLNNYSIVVKVEFGNNSLLLAGDAEDISEKEMMDKGFNLKADVLKVGHHGSNSSTTREFLNAVNPKYAVISVGKGNDYGHPATDTIQKLHAKGINIYRTDESGTIVATSDGTNITFNTNPSTTTVGGTAPANNKNSISNSTSSTVNNNSGVQASQDKTTTVWVSKNNGKVYHFDKSCSGMKNPVQMTLEEAQSKGLRACKKCAN